MRIFRSTALAAVLAMTAASVAAPSAQAQISIGISVNFAPPPLPVYEQPPIPDPDYIWVPGYWAWDEDAYDYYWVPGTWAPAPEPGLLWTPAWWGWDDGGYAFHDGYWAPHVGYYGGIAYGFGYNGSDYEGGQWRGGHFFYNRTVNNVTNVNITNVYNKTVIVNQGPRASFNGPGGASAQPTSQQLAVAQERHAPPTPLQIRQVKAAAAMPTLRAAANHGAPPVAATARPAAFSGPGVVKTAHAGGDYHPPATAVARQAQARAGHPTATPAPELHPAPAAEDARPASPRPQNENQTRDTVQSHEDKTAPRPPEHVQDRAQDHSDVQAAAHPDRGPAADRPDTAQKEDARPETPAERPTKPLETPRDRPAPTPLEHHAQPRPESPRPASAARHAPPAAPRRPPASKPEKKPQNG